MWGRMRRAHWLVWISVVENLSSPRHLSCIRIATLNMMDRMPWLAELFIFIIMAITQDWFGLQRLGTRWRVKTTLYCNNICFWKIKLACNGACCIKLLLMLLIYTLRARSLNSLPWMIIDRWTNTNEFRRVGFSYFNNLFLIFSCHGLGCLSSIKTFLSIVLLMRIM